ncbi:MULTISPECIES: hypothetical protein [Enterobacterales]|nr:MULTISPECIES: hypothetical protein [Enterobacterales]
MSRQVQSLSEQLRRLS